MAAGGATSAAAARAALGIALCRGLGIVLGSAGVSVNHAGSFVAMGALGFTLATKQASRSDAGGARVSP